jgi:hypothetical protein
MSHAASTAIGVGLGSSISGFILESGTKFMALDRILTNLDRRFRDVEGSASRAGAAIQGAGAEFGYATAEAGMLGEALGSQTNRINIGEFRRYAGFARFTGMDPNAAMGGLGHLGHLVGHGGGLSNRQLLTVLGAARRHGMDQGRLGEYVQGVGATAEGMLEATGRVDFDQLMGLQRMPRLLYGADDPRGQGALGMSTMSGLNQSLTGNAAARTFLMRAMGYGQAGGPSYIEAKKRLDAGVYDPRNLQDMFDAFRARGMGRGAQFRAIESISGGSLKAYEIEKIVDLYGGSPGTVKDAFDGSEASRDRSSAARGGGPRGFEGVAGMGGMISLGERSQVELEGMQMEVGRFVAQSAMESRDILMDLLKIAKNVTGLDGTNIGELIVSLLERLNRYLDTAAALEHPYQAAGYMMGIPGVQNPGLQQPAAGSRP